MLIFLVLAGVFTFLYFKFEKPAKEQEQIIYYTNLTIFAQDKENHPIKTTYLVYLNGSLYDGGITDKFGGVTQRVTTGNTFYIRNENFPDQKYYTSEIKFYSDKPDKSNRIVLELNERGELDISQDGAFGTNETIILNVSTNETFKNLMYCLKWSELLIFVKSMNDDRIDGQIDDNYKCYETDRTVDEKHYMIIKINYNTISPITSNDYLRVQFYDKDELLSQNYTKRQEYFLK